MLSGVFHPGGRHRIRRRLKCRYVLPQEIPCDQERHTWRALPSLPHVLPIPASARSPLPRHRHSPVAAGPVVPPVVLGQRHHHGCHTVHLRVRHPRCRHPRCRHPRASRPPWVSRLGPPYEVSESCMAIQKPHFFRLNDASSQLSLTRCRRSELGSHPSCISHHGDNHASGGTDAHG
jgi:hypothetical protein